MSFRRRSSAPKVLGILNLIGGFLGLLISLVSLVQLLAVPTTFGPRGPANPADPAAIDAFMTANVSGYHAIQYAGIAISLVLDVLLIVSGFGLLYYREWARRLAILYAVLSLLSKLATALYQVLVFVPAMSAFYDTVLMGTPMAATAGFLKGILYGTVVFSLVFAVYPIVVLSLLLSKSGKAAFEPAPLEDEDDYDDRRGRFEDRPRRDDDRYGARDDRGRR
jgi:hypothetical protein